MTSLFHHGLVRWCSQGGWWCYRSSTTSHYSPPHSSFVPPTSSSSSKSKPTKGSTGSSQPKPTPSPALLHRGVKDGHRDVVSRCFGQISRSVESFLHERNFGLWSLTRPLPVTHPPRAFTPGFLSPASLSFFLPLLPSVSLPFTFSLSLTWHPVPPCLALQHPPLGTCTLKCDKAYHGNL